ncbi:hypothetical protein GCM10007933_22950 [Zoogloea oryzae]|uniref:Uncharacterized protein n=2 Tax=Zoogloea oryzae TaxID=310767 RepID=A0ABQ6FCW3_9RHOO|nr:hypothetical protein GCM10007933_22950 [Zoogloea oryzae]
MYSVDELRNFCIEILLEDRSPGMIKATRLGDLKGQFPGKSDQELQAMARQSDPDAWAYRDELAAKTYAELLEMATAVNDRKKAQERLQKKPSIYAKWARKPFWTKTEAVALLLGCDPDGDASIYDYPDERNDLTDLLDRAIKVGQLKREMSPPNLLSWAQSAHLSVPSALAQAVDELKPKPPSAPSGEAPSKFLVNIEGYDSPPELAVMVEAIARFWTNVDRNRPPKKDEEIIPWIRSKVDSDVKANAIDLLIRPEWARVGGNRKR